PSSCRGGTRTVPEPRAVRLLSSCTAREQFGQSRGTGVRTRMLVTCGRLYAIVQQITQSHCGPASELFPRALQVQTASKRTRYIPLRVPGREIDRRRKPILRRWVWKRVTSNRGYAVLPPARRAVASACP